MPDMQICLSNQRRNTDSITEGNAGEEMMKKNKIRKEIREQVKQARERIFKGKFITNKEILKEFNF